MRCPRSPRMAHSLSAPLATVLCRAVVCPTGAAAYALPPADALIRKLRALISAYRDAGGTRPTVLFHDEAHGAPLIDALGDGAPKNVLPLAVNEVSQVGLEAIAAA